MRLTTITLVLPLLLTSLGCSRSGAAEPEARESSNRPERLANSASFSCPSIDGEGFSLTHLEATKMSMRTAGTRYPGMNVILANYDRQGGSYHPSAGSDGQRRLLLTFSGAAGDELAPGTFSVEGQMGAENRLSIGIESSGATCGLYNGEGSGEILSLSDTALVGKVSVKDSEGTWIEATFSVSYEVSPY